MSKLGPGLISEEDLRGALGYHSHKVVNPLSSIEQVVHYWSQGSLKATSTRYNIPTYKVKATVSEYSKYLSGSSSPRLKLCGRVLTGLLQSSDLRGFPLKARVKCVSPETKEVPQVSEKPASVDLPSCEDLLFLLRLSFEGVLVKYPKYLVVAKLTSELNNLQELFSKAWSTKEAQELGIRLFHAQKYEAPDKLLQSKAESEALCSNLGTRIQFLTLALIKLGAAATSA